jgi:hypothetical protein
MNKFILVPEDVYRSLLQTDTGDINLDFTKHALDRVKNEKRAEASRKNVNLSQELRRYLHLKKEHDKKPVLVDVPDLDDRLKAALQGNIVPSPPSFPLSPILPPAASSTPVQQTPPPAPQSPASPAPSSSRQSFNTVASQHSAAGPSQPAAEEQGAEQQQQATPRTSKSLKFNLAELEKISKLDELISSKPMLFKVDGNKVLHDKSQRPIMGSSVIGSLQCIVAGKTGKWEGLSPPGTKELESRLMMNPATKGILKKLAPAGTTKSPKQKKAPPARFRKEEAEEKIYDKFHPSLWQ